MFPVLSSNDTQHLPFTDIELFRDTMSAKPTNTEFVCCANSEHLFSREFGVSVSFANTTTKLRCSIPSIVSMSSDKEMFGVAAPRMIAVMAGKHTIWDWSNGRFIGVPVSHGKLPGKTGDAIPGLVSGRQPRPASIWSTGFVNTTPKVLGAIQALHKEEAPATIEVKPAQWSGNDDNEGERVLGSTVFKAALRPSQN